MAVVRAAERTWAGRSPVSTESPTALRTGLGGPFGMGEGPGLSSLDRAPECLLHEGPRLVDEALQVRLAEEALGVDLVNVLGA